MFVVNDWKFGVFQCLYGKIGRLWKDKTFVGSCQTVFGTKARSRFFGFVVNIKCS